MRLISDRSVRQRRQGKRNCKDEIFLPEDVMIDILLRVPAETVFAFRGLSKYYRDLTQSAEFIRKHYEVSLRTRPSILLHQRKNNDGSDPSVIRLDFESGSKVDELIPPFNSMVKGLSFLGCQRGILCYKVAFNIWNPISSELGEVNNLIFWNPITRGCRRSRCADTISSSLNSMPNSYSCVRYFFRFDSVADDSKVLKITRVLTHERKYEYECVVYSSKTGSWTRTGGFDHIRSDKGKRLTLDMHSIGAEAFVEGSNFNCVHMLAHFNHVSEGKQVLAYDFTAQKFKLVPLPKRHLYSLSTMDGCLCLLFPSSWTCGLEGWIMKDYEDAESWATLFSIRSKNLPYPLRYHERRPTGLVVINGSPHLLIQTGNHRSKSELYMYDVNRKQFNDARSDLDHVQKERLSRVLENTFIPKHFLFVPSHRQP